MSWIALDDVVYGLYRLITDESLSGPVNLVAPHPVTNTELTRTLARVLGRPSLLPVPGSAVTLGFGEMGRSVLLGGALIVPRRLSDAGHAFAYPSLEGALRHLLGRNAPSPSGFTVELHG
jgi:NAD dependent epimerase/dehydratase family enzyme